MEKTGIWLNKPNKDRTEDYFKEGGERKYQLYQCPAWQFYEGLPKKHELLTLFKHCIQEVNTGNLNT